MNVQICEIPGVVLLEPRVFPDPRGFFLECFQKARYQAAGIPGEFVQDNYSHSVHGVLRGLHYQIQHPQGKLLWTVRGEIFDVVVDLRRDSPMFGRHWVTHLSEANHRQLYVPPGLAHGFCVLSDVADVIYKCTEAWYPLHECTLLWSDPALAIPWPVRQPLMSEKDQQGLTFAAAPYFETTPQR
jgi:dTDP-4-dehydrorhamnose 3,5-epimerase